MMKRAIPSLTALALATLPSLAEACPNCIGGQGDRYAAVLKLVGLFMAIPFVAFFVVLKIIRSAPPRAADQISPK